jgi:hypothetical protein
MPIIVPPSRNQLGEAIAELTALGGIVKQDFRLTFSGADAVLEVSDDLYKKWKKKNPAEAKESEARESSTPEQETESPEESSSGKDDSDSQRSSGAAKQKRR